MVWTLRLFDEEKALMLFGDRVAAHELEPVVSAGATTDAASQRR